MCHGSGNRAKRVGLREVTSPALYCVQIPREPPLSTGIRTCFTRFVILFLHQFWRPRAKTLTAA
jgi:hypothetical protein